MMRFSELGRTCALLTLLAAPALAQESKTAVTGIVMDPAGSFITGAEVVLQPAGTGVPQTVRTGPGGRYSLSGAPGVYHLEVRGEGFAPFIGKPFTLGADHAASFDVRLRIEEQMQQVDVTPDSELDTDPNQNGDQITLKGKDIDALPLDSAELSRELTALSGGDAPEIYLNGFSGGSIPPRDTIREIRINQNPYSAQNDTNPVNGQLQIFTKPGSDKLHGSIYGYGNDSSFNALNPFIRIEPAYHSSFIYANVSGPVTKHTSFFVNGGRNSSSSNSIIAASTSLDANGQPVSFTQAVATPSSGLDLTVRIDTSLGKKSTLTAQYSIDTSTQLNGGIGQLALASTGYNNDSTVQVFQAANSQVISSKIVNDTRFQYKRGRVRQTPDSFDPALYVQGAFTGGGSSAGAYNDNQDRYELQNYWSAAEGKHYFTFGGRFRATRDANHSRANYNGSYTFASLSSYLTTVAGQAAGLSGAAIRAMGGGATQFTLSAGTPDVAVTQSDAGLFFQDDWKLRKNLTLSPGLRVETQNAIHDHADFAPRLGISYGFLAKKNKPPVYVLRGGAGLFYKRFTSGYLLQAIRQNCVTQQSYVINNPDTYPAIPTAASLATAGSAVNSATFQISPTFHAPYFFSGTVSLQRQLGTHGSVTLSYLEGRGMNSQLTRNINAPLPGTYDLNNPASGVRPMGGSNNVYEYQSEGRDRSHRVSVNTNLRFKDRLFFWGFYQLRYNDTDTSGGFPSNQYNLAADYGRSTNDQRHQVNGGANAQLLWGFHAYGFLQAHTGAPFNITLSQDVNGDGQFNDRPTFATDLTRASVVKTSYGNFDTSPVAGQTTIPINYGRGPSFVNANFGFGRSFNFGPVEKAPAGMPAPKLKPGEKPHVDHKFELDLSIDADNVFNHVNYGQPISVLGAASPTTTAQAASTTFGTFNSITGNGNNAANRTVNVQAYFHF